MPSAFNKTLSSTCEVLNETSPLIISVKVTSSLSGILIRTTCGVLAANNASTSSLLNDNELRILARTAWLYCGEGFSGVLKLLRISSISAGVSKAI